MIQNVFIIGSKGIPGAYGGYETFVDRLTEYHQQNKKIQYHVACKGKKAEEKEYHHARCFYVKVPNLGPAQAIYYDVAALHACVSYVKKNHIENPIIYILACRIGPFARYYLKKIHRFGGKMFVNPDGHEWKRSKWNYFVRKYWKLSERLMVKYADLLVCDSVNIEKYIQKEYKKYLPHTTYISYGAEIVTDKRTSQGVTIQYNEWLKKYNVQKGEYYLIVGRFVPENNYEVMIREFMRSNTSRKLIIICNQNRKLQKELLDKLQYEKDNRICFAGTVYDKILLEQIRKHACGYIHGHEVGGTNPSLLEALGSTDLNLLLGVGFNREVAQESAWYWTKEPYNLAKLIEKADGLSEEERKKMGQKAKTRIRDAYSWKKIADQYEELFIQGVKNVENTAS